MEKIIILGMGGHAKSVADTIERQSLYEIYGFVVNEKLADIEQYHYPVVGSDGDLQKLFMNGTKHVAMGIGFLGKSRLRERLYLQLREIGYSFPIICDPSAIVSRCTSIGEGTFIGKGAIVNVSAQIGKMCILNAGAIIEHDCHVGDFSHVSVGTVLCGEVKIGKESFIGANATVIQGRRIGVSCIVGAGATVRKDIVESRTFIYE